MDTLWKFSLYITCNEDLAEDVLQEALLRAYIKRNELRVKSPKIFTAWVKMIMRHFIIDGKRKTKDQIQPQFDFEKCLAFDPLKIAERKEIVKEVKKAMDRLSDYHKEAFVLYLKGKTKEEMAKQIGVPLGTAMSRLYYARKRMQELCA